MSTPDDTPPEAVTHLLGRLHDGDGSAADELLPLVYGELRELARAVFAGRAAGHTLQPTALVHEAWVKMAGHVDALNDRKHFFVVAAKAMRQVLADHAKGKLRDRRGGGRRHVTLDTRIDQARPGIDVVELDDSLRRLAERNERHAAIAELRLLTGLSIDETAEALGLSPRTVDADWAMAKAWLRRELGGP